MRIWASLRLDTLCWRGPGCLHREIANVVRLVTASLGRHVDERFIQIGQEFEVGFHGRILPTILRLARADAPDRLIAPLQIRADLCEAHLQCELRVEFFVG